MAKFATNSSGGTTDSAIEYTTSYLKWIQIQFSQQFSQQDNSRGRQRVKSYFHERVCESPRIEGFHILEGLDEMRILTSVDFNNLVSFPRYRRLKLEFVFDQILHVKLRPSYCIIT